jgi:hypothetical protein
MTTDEGGLGDNFLEHFPHTASGRPREPRRRSRAKGSILTATLDDYLDLSAWRRGDHVIVASNPWLISDVAFDIAVACNVHAVHGSEGADTMLLSLSPVDFVARRYDRLVIGSGDGAFASRAASVRQSGVAVQVVARSDGCSKRLRRFDCRYIDQAVQTRLAA